MTHSSVQSHGAQPPCRRLSARTYHADMTARRIEETNSRRLLAAGYRGDTAGSPPATVDAAVSLTLGKGLSKIGNRSIWRTFAVSAVRTAARCGAKTLFLSLAIGLGSCRKSEGVSLSWPAKIKVFKSP